ncbi:MAG: carbohydrate kinase family protein [Flammeovirgaceae bacterium]
MTSDFQTYDLLAVGELLIDLLSNENNTLLQDSQLFHKHPGGSAANLATNLAKQGKKTALVSCVGNDGFGHFLINELQQAGVATHAIRKDEAAPTSMAIISRSDQTPDFILYRAADKFIQLSQLPDQLLANCRIFHTTCFALSQQPARRSILDAAKRAHHFGNQLTIDLNYAIELWPDRSEATLVLEEFFKLKPWIKLSEDDCQRLYGQRFQQEEALFSYLHGCGVPTICFTKGKAGCTISTLKDGKQFFEAPKVDKVDHATGAGDAFWSGFIAAHLEGASLTACVANANRIAAIKLQTFGPLPKLT